MNVTRAVLPVMRRQRSGHVISISSGAGLVGFEFGTAYAASKFGLEGWMESLRPEVAPFGIHTTHRQPRLLPHRAADAGVHDLRRDVDRRLRRAPRRAATDWTDQNGKQSGDPAKLAQALVTIADEEPPRRRFIAGADSIASPSRRSPTCRPTST